MAETLPPCGFNPSKCFIFIFITSLIIQVNKLLWCPVYKAGTTNWMLNIAKLAGTDESEETLARR